MIDPKWVYIDDDELMRAAACAQRRLADAKAAGAKDRFDSDSYESHFYGAITEIAAAKMLGLPWECHSKVWAQPDVGRYEVRGIGPASKPYVKAKANDKHPILVGLLNVDVTRTVRTVIFAGWTTPEYVREHGRRRDPGNRGAPAYFIDIYDLIGDIPELA